MKKLRIFLFSFFTYYLFIIHYSFASHNRAGEITYRHITGLEYEITITTYTKTSRIAQGVDRPVLDIVHYGDGTTDAFTRYLRVDTVRDISINYYKHKHIYPGTGTYNIYFEDPNRNLEVINIPNAVNTPFAIQTQLSIRTGYTPNNSAILLNPPIDRGCIGSPFIHNAGAYDPDGDSLSYELTICRGAGNLPIPGYTFPHAFHQSSTFTIDDRTGDLVWNAPDSIGQYNVAFYIIEWRKIGKIWNKIGFVERDMQIEIVPCVNQPPVIQNLKDTCVLAGDSIGLVVTATDPNHDFVTLSAFGYPMHISPDPAVFIPGASNGGNDTVTGLFSWKTTCKHVAQQPYRMEFKAEDNNTQVNLVDFKGFFITVIGPAPKNLVVTPNGSSMDLHWSPNGCSQVIGYNIYYRAGSYPGTIECPCQTGVPAYTGYQLVGSTNNINDTTFNYSNNGQGLAIGVSNCFIVTAVFPGGVESCASIQVCAQLKKDLPVITNVTIDSTGTLGSDTVMWSKATEIDTAVFPPPYQYKIYGAPGFSGGSAFILLATLPTEDDTIYRDSPINTDTQPWRYKVELYYDSAHAGIPVRKGETQTASSVFLTLTPTDNKMILSWEEHVPWSNYRYDIFRLDTVTALWDSIGNTTLKTFADSNLTNGDTYCYYVRSVGSYGTDGMIDPIINLSERECGVPIDNVPPCPPQLGVLSDCIENANLLTWNNPNNSCADDVMSYHIYFAPDSLGDIILVATITNANDTTYIHQSPSPLIGCYRVTAIDSTNNESKSVPVCIDTCRQYVLPSVFTPNGDGDNDFFHPCDSTTAPDLQKKNCPPYRNVKDVEMKIFNRWGNLVFETTDKNINWDGKNKFSKGNCPDGVYYYTCKVNFFSLKGAQMIELKGYIHLIRGK